MQETGNSRTGRRLAFLINFLYGGVMVALVLLAAYILLKWMLPFVFAFLAAFALQRPLRWLVRRTRVSIKFFSVFFVALIILLLAALVALITWWLVGWLTGFFSDAVHIRDITATLTGVSAAVQRMLEGLSGLLSAEAVDALQAAIADATARLVRWVTSLFADAAGWAFGFTTRLPMMLVGFIMWVAASIFLTIDFDAVTGFFMRQIPPRHATLVRTARDLCTGTLARLLRAYALLMAVTFVELALGFTLLDVGYAPALAALIAALDILPVLGTGTALLPWAAVALIMGDTWRGWGLLLLYGITALVRNILEPRLISRQIGLHPLVTLFFMFLGMKAAGLLGMLAFPVAVMVLVQLQENGQIRLWKP